MKRRSFLTKSIMLAFVGSALIWLPAVNQLAEKAGTVDSTLIWTTLLAQVGILALVALNHALNAHRARTNRENTSDT